MTDNTGVRTPDPDDENENTDQDDGDIGLRIGEGVKFVTPQQYMEMVQRHQRAVIETFGQFAQSIKPQPPSKPVEEPPAEDIPVKLYGMGVIKDMSDEDIVEELLYHQGNIFRRLDRHQLVHAVISMRLSAYKTRLADESGLDGWHHVIEDED